MCPWTEAAHCSVCETFVCKKYTHFFWKRFKLVSSEKISRLYEFLGPFAQLYLEMEVAFFFTENEKFFMSSTASRVRVEWVFFFEENLLAESWKDWEKESPIWCFDDVLSLSRAHDLLVFRSRSAQRPDVFKIYIYDLLCITMRKKHRIRGRKWTRKKRT